MEVCGQSLLLYPAHHKFISFSALDRHRAASFRWRISKTCYAKRKEELCERVCHVVLSAFAPPILWFGMPNCDRPNAQFVSRWVPIILSILNSSSMLRSSQDALLQHMDSKQDITAKPRAHDTTQHACRHASLLSIFNYMGRLFMLFIVYHTQFMWEATHGHWDSCRWVSHSWPMATPHNCIRPNRCMFSIISQWCLLTVHGLDTTDLECISPAQHLWRGIFSSFLYGWEGWSAKATGCHLQSQQQSITCRSQETWKRSLRGWEGSYRPGEHGHQRG